MQKEADRAFSYYQWKLKHGISYEAYKLAKKTLADQAIDLAVIR